MGFVAIVASSTAAFVRDMRRKQLSSLSKVIAGAWAVCVALIILVELFDSFP